MPNMRIKFFRILSAIFILSIVFLGCDYGLVSESLAGNSDESKLNGDYRKNVILAKFEGDPDVHRVVVFPDESVEDTLSRVGNQSNVEYAETNAIYHIAVGLTPNDYDFDKQWYLDQINAKEAWLNTNGSKNVVVAVLDSGADLDHPDLENNIWLNPDETIDGRDNDFNGYIDDIHGWNFVERNNDPNPRFEEGWSELGLHHGTIVSGILGAQGNNGRDIAGVAWKVGIMPLRVLDSAGSGDARDVVSAIDYAIEKGADILNLSFVGFSYNRTLEAAIERAHNAGLLIVAAAGNDVSGSTGFNLDSEPMYPVCYDGPEGENWILGVTALDPLDQKAYFASYGNSCIDIAAPGVGIWSTVVYKPAVNLKKYTKGYWSGTSVAVPQVAGLAALLYSMRPTLGASEVFNIIIHSADSVDSINPEYRGRLGAGRINAKSAVQLLSGEQVSNFSVTLNPYIIVAPSSGSLPEVKIFSVHGHEIKSFMAYHPNFRGGVEVVSADIDGDGYPEIITGAGPGGGPHVRIFSYDGRPLGGFFAFPQNFRGGVHVAAADLDGDGKAEIITGAGTGMEPVVNIFRPNGLVIDSFMAYMSAFRGGVRVATGDLEGDGYPEIITGAGPGGGPHVRIFRYDGVPLSGFFAFSENFRGGVHIAAGDLYGDGKDEIIIGSGSGGSPEVKVFDFHEGEKIGFYAYEPWFKGGVNVSTVDTDVDSKAEILTGPASGYLSKLRVFNSMGLLTANISAHNSAIRNGITVAGMWR